MVLSLIILLICEGLVLLFAAYLVWSLISKTPFYPSRVSKLNKNYLDGKIFIPKTARFIDLGSGDGRIVLWAADKVSYAEGIEFNPFLSLFSKLILFIRGFSGKTKIMNKNFYNHNYSNYDIAYMYIFPEHMGIIKDKLLKEMPKGSSIITNTFQIPGLDPDERHDRFFIYKVK